MPGHRQFGQLPSWSAIYQGCRRATARGNLKSTNQQGLSDLPTWHTPSQAFWPMQPLRGNQKPCENISKLIHKCEQTNFLPFRLFTACLKETEIGEHYTLTNNPFWVVDQTMSRKLKCQQTGGCDVMEMMAMTSLVSWCRCSGAVNHLQKGIGRNDPHGLCSSRSCGPQRRDY